MWEYSQTHIFISAPERLTGKLSKNLSFSQLGHKHLIKGIQARANRTLPVRNKRVTCTGLKANAH